MPSSKRSNRSSNRSKKPLSKNTDAVVKAEAVGVGASFSSTAGVHKHEGKTRGATARQRKKLQSALIKKVDSRNSEEALAEQSVLLGAPSPSPTETKPPKSRGKARRGAKAEKKYMDDILNDEGCVGDKFQRSKRWIPDFEHRTRPIRQPATIPYGLWMSYKFLDDYIYRHSLSVEEIQALPLIDDVHEYQNSDGKTPKPITPPGYQFDENLELVPITDQST